MNNQYIYYFEGYPKPRPMLFSEALRLGYDRFAGEIADSMTCVEAAYLVCPEARASCWGLYSKSTVAFENVFPILGQDIKYRYEEGSEKKKEPKDRTMGLHHLLIILEVIHKWNGPQLAKLVELVEKGFKGNLIKLVEETNAMPSPGTDTSIKDT